MFLSIRRRGRLFFSIFGFGKKADSYLKKINLI